MPNTLQIRSLPDTYNGLSITSTATAWTPTQWVNITKNVPSDMYIQGITFETAFVLAANDTTNEQLFEVGNGHSSNIQPIIQIPHSIRADTRVGFYMPQAYKIFLPEPRFISQGDGLFIRIYRSISTAVVYNGIKIIYQGNQRIIDTSDPKVILNNYLFFGSDSAGIISISEKRR